MWAAIKSDLKEFASVTAEETTAVAEKAASKVGVNLPATDDYSSTNNNNAGGGNNTAAAGKKGVMGKSVDGSVLLAQTALSMGTQGLKGLSSVTSMVGGIVAPRTDNNTNATTAASSSGRPMYTANSSTSSFASSTPPGGGGNNITQPSAALSSMLASGEDSEEEEELGWDDDDDDFDMDNDDDKKEDKNDTNDELDGDNKAPTEQADGGEEEQVDFTNDEDKVSEEQSTTCQSADATTLPTTTIACSNDDKQALQALQSKLEQVERSRAELQSVHRKQTAELVELRSFSQELRSKVEERNSQEEATQTTTTTINEEESERGGEIQSLQDEIAQLKVQLDEQLKTLSSEHEQVVQALIQEKAAIEKELDANKVQNENLSRENQTLQEQARAYEASAAASSSEEQELLKKYQQQIQDLTSELSSLQATLDTTTSELTRVKEYSTNQEKSYQEILEGERIKTTNLEQTLMQLEEAHSTAVRELDESKAKLSNMEEQLQDAKDEVQQQSVKFEQQLQDEIAKVKLLDSKKDELDEHIIATSSSTASVDDAVKKDGELNDTFETANNDEADEDVLAQQRHDEKEASSSSGSTPVKVKLDISEEDELSDDWGDGEW